MASASRRRLGSARRPRTLSGGEAAPFAWGSAPAEGLTAPSEGDPGLPGGAFPQCRAGLRRTTRNAKQSRWYVGGRGKKNVPYPSPETRHGVFQRIPQSGGEHGSICTVSTRQSGRQAFHKHLFSPTALGMCRTAQHIAVHGRVHSIPQGQ
ncbi:hypothetical protein SKAU_G00304290 [Synaphobranchus kaupii]|uniref:Uncharacterized protein n=1 Tax=Synaphobranchus kaupii TaxID=118154 RepID=A0A9Q1EWA1_SYNKA|nr:hypothetical protein SKAU_G00304290 [Synaphobranchus kaupii]